MLSPDWTEPISRRTGLPRKSVAATVELLDSGAGVPFIARYRKAKTGGLDEDQIRSVEKALKYFRELHERKQTVLKTIEAQGKLTPELRACIEACSDAEELEDLYLPYKPKRKTKAALAREQGLEPLARLMLTAVEGDAETIARRFMQGEICTPKEAVQGAQYIIAEEIAENAQIRAHFRKILQSEGKIFSRKRKTDHKEAYKFDLYDGASFELCKIKPHQILAILRGENLEILSVKFGCDEQSVARWIASKLGVNERLVFAQQCREAIDIALTRYLGPSIEREVRRRLKETADAHAVKVFAQNLKNLLLTPPLAGKVVLGIDPGYASGCKIAVVDAQGNYLHGDVIYPTPPKNLTREAEAKLVEWVRKYRVDVVAVGNGTACRETEIFVAETIKKHALNARYLIVDEAGASVYSVSEIAQKEFPHLDPTQRGNVSIARRVQDPLAELVKINPKSIGVGMYQHDVDERMLEDELTAVVVSAVNEVGVDVNTASAKLLSFVSGLSERLANEIVETRRRIGRFDSREQLKIVKGMGEKTFEQAAGFLRVRDGIEPLDNTAIHPEAYAQVKQLAAEMRANDCRALGAALAKLPTAKAEALMHKTGLDPHTFKLIVENLLRPGRDPREDVPPPVLRGDVVKIEDLREGMSLRGTVRNVVDFGAFVDVGLKNDALLHVSKIRKFAKAGLSPADVIKVGDVISVVVEKIDLEKERVSLDWIAETR
ncbi:MAG: RNA-binding transcriptional accessory protein [Bacteroidia bacterium]|nr:RNA-binding transcriptional accessory protein [Bacteroidia bacterium]